MNELFEAFKQECRQMRIRLYNEQCHLGEIYKRYQMSGQPELLGTERRSLLAMLTEAQQRLGNVQVCLDKAVEAYARGKANLFADKHGGGGGIAEGLTLGDVAASLLKDYQKRHAVSGCPCSRCQARLAKEAADEAKQVKAAQAAAQAECNCASCQAGRAS